MLNLVQLQERLRDVPLQALMQYANGANPQIPPFLALTEMNRRKKMQESAAAEQAKQMEGAPTVKQQIEQAAGLMALQGSRQQQAAQQQQSTQAAMPMAAPNTTTSEPAQLASGGYIEDTVVPRDYQRGGVINPDELKRLMLREAMQGDVEDIPKELTSAVARAALRRRPGIAGVPLPTNMFKRADYAGGGIVAFAGPEGSFVETRPGFYELESEEKDEEKPAGLDDMYRNLIQRQMQRKLLQERIKEANLEKPPEAAKEELAELQRSLQEQKSRASMDQLMTFLSGVAEARGGNWATQGAAGAKQAIALGKEQRAGITALNQQMAKIKDLREKAAYDAARGNIEKSAAEEQAADKELADLLSKMSRSQYEGALKEQALAGKTSNLREMYKTELAGLVSEGKDPNDPAVQREAMRRAAYYTAPLAGPRVEATERGIVSANERAAIDKYSELFDPRKLLYGPLSDEMYAAAARDKKEGTGNRYQNEIRLREYNRIRQGLSLPPARSLPGSAPAGGSTGGSAPPPPPGFVVPKK